MIIFSIASIFMNKPSKATIVKSTVEDTSTAAKIEKTNTIKAKYFSLDYDAGLDTVSNISAGDKTALEVYRVARSDTSGRRTFVITIKSLPKGGMSEESSYKLRHINPDTYNENTKEYGGQSFVVFDKKDGSESTAFIANGDKLAILAYTLATPNGDLEEESAELFSAFRWVN